MPSSMEPQVSGPRPAKIVPKPAPADRKFPCKKCGAQLDFDPAARALHCPFCGFLERIEPASKEVQATNWDEYWRTHARGEAMIAGRSSQVTCLACGAVVLLEDRVATDKCPYCGAFLENQPETAKKLIAPAGLLPFTLTDRHAREAFNQWIARRWFAPNGLYQFANLGQLAGVYVPFWTFDSMTFTHYTGERGDDYTETETYTETDANGREVTKTRQVTKTRWTRVSGEVQHFFENVLTYASRSLPDSYVSHLGPWPLAKMEEFKAEFLSAFQTERYTIGLRDGFEKARAVMDAEIRMLCEQDIGGDHQRLDMVQTQHVGTTFKHVLLPIWVAAYRYANQPYRILVNGQTGKVVGSRPYSWIKITMLVLIIIAVILAALVLFATAARGGACATAVSAVPPQACISGVPYVKNLS